MRETFPLHVYSPRLSACANPRRGTATSRSAWPRRSTASPRTRQPRARPPASRCPSATCAPGRRPRVCLPPPARPPARPQLPAPLVPPPSTEQMGAPPTPVDPRPRLRARCPGSFAASAPGFCTRWWVTCPPSRVCQPGRCTTTSTWTWLQAASSASCSVCLPPPPPRAARAALRAA